MAMLSSTELIAATLAGAMVTNPAAFRRVCSKFENRKARFARSRPPAEAPYWAWVSGSFDRASGCRASNRWLRRNPYPRPCHSFEPDRVTILMMPLDARPNSAFPPALMI